MGRLDSPRVGYFTHPLLNYSDGQQRVDKKTVYYPLAYGSRSRKTVNAIFVVNWWNPPNRLYSI